MKIVIADDLPALRRRAAREVEGGRYVDARAGRPLLELLDCCCRCRRARSCAARRASRRRDRGGADAARDRARAGTGVGQRPTSTPPHARGIVVMNAPGANSISVAELALAQLLALARHLPGGRRGDEGSASGRRRSSPASSCAARRSASSASAHRTGSAPRARRSFGMQIVAHDPFISAELGRVSWARKLASLDEVCAAADYLTLHLPVTPQTRHLFNAERLAKCKKGIRIMQHRAAASSIDVGRARRRRLGTGQVAAAAIDVFEQEPPIDWAIASCPTSSPTHTSRRRPGEAQELVGVETAAAVRDLPARRHHPQRRELPVAVGRRVPRGCALGQRWPSGSGRWSRRWAKRGSPGVGVRYYGELAAGRSDLLRERRAGRALPPHAVGRRHRRQRQGRWPRTAASR